ncbi:mdn1 [Symbiodinium natans]|uniref:Mdn1 protein n=1 Tax=Symbiodinium natans TaxID=878477 RepID=A0A812NGS1_9DINO|nr:mdn1 [Symbiodinium natans]
MSELQNLSSSASGFVQRLTSRFPLHADLTGPVLLSVQALVHGLQLLHRHLWQHQSASALAASAAGVADAPQSPASEPGGLQAALGLEVEEALGNPEVLCWWLRWTTLSRRRASLQAPPPHTALQMLRRLSVLQQEDEDLRAKEDIDALTPFKLAKAKKPDDAEDEDAGRQEALFPGENQVEALAALGLNEDGTAETDGAEGDGVVTGGSSLYDLWSTSKVEAGKKRAKTSDSQGQGTKFHLQPQQIADICDFSLECFGEEALALQEADELRLDSLDASLEIFVRLCVCGLASDRATTTLLPAAVGQRLSPLVMLRLLRTARQLQPGPMVLTDAESIGKKRTAAEARRSLHSAAASAFYAESSPAILLQLAAPLAALLTRVRDLLAQFEEHPSLLAIEGLVEKMMALNLLQTTPMVIVTMLELLLGRVVVWEEAASRHVSLQAQTQPLKALVVSLRERQLLEWKGLRQIRERFWERNSSKWWLHLIGLLSEAADSRSLVDELLRFMRTAPLGEFRTRLQMLRAAARLQMEAEGNTSMAGLVAHHVWNFSRKWLPAIEKELAKAQQAMEKEVQDLVKIVRWDLSNYHALKDSASRSHRQLSRAIKRFDDSLQELVDLVLSSASSSAKPAPAHHSRRFTVEAFALATAAEMPSGQVSGRVSDSDEFWSDAQSVVGALPSMLSSLGRMIGQQLLPDSFCLSAAAGSGVLEVAEDLCSETGSVLESLQDQETTLPVKRRRLHGLKEICANFGFVPRPVHDSSFDVADFFCSLLATPFAAEATQKDEPKDDNNEAKPSLQPERPLKRLRTKQRLAEPVPAEDQAGRSFLDDFKAEVECCWARTDDLTYEILHLALRLHSTKSRPKDLTAGEMQVWLGLAAASIQALRCHRERCVAFHNVVAQFEDTCSVSLAEVSLKVPSKMLRATFMLLDRLLEGGQQARLVGKARKAGSCDEAMQAAIASFESTVSFVHGSEEFRCCRATSDFSAHLHVKVRFLHSLIAKASAAIKQMDEGLTSAAGLVPASMASSLKRSCKDLESSLSQLQACLEPPVAPSAEALRPLRLLLLAVQHTREVYSSDPSISMSAATKPTGNEAEQEEEALAVPQLGLGREKHLKALLEILPLSQIHDALGQHLEQLPSSFVSPLAPFSSQILQLARALLLGGLQAALATAEVSFEILRLVCFLMEKGLNSKEEEEQGEGEGEGGTEWQTGTGMGEGEGLKDVTDEIEDDAQLEGTRNEKQEQQPEPEQPKQSEDNAREVGFDLDTEAKAMPQEEDDKNQDEEKDNDDEQDLDRQQGEVDLSKGGTLDEKLWNGEDEDDKDDKEDGDAPEEKEKGPQEDIEAHGAQGEGEADTTAKDENDSKSNQKPSEDDRKADKDAKDVPEQEPQEPDKTEFEDKDAQFDVQMQPQERDGAEGEGEGEGQGEGEGEGDGEGDADSDFIKSDIDMDGDGDGGDDGEGSEGSKCEEDIGDLDAADPGVPEEKPPDDAGAEEQEGIDPCVQGEQKPDQQDQEQQDQDGDKKPENVDPSKAKQKAAEEKVPEPLKQGDPGANPSGKDTTAPQQQQQDDQMFGGSTGEAANFESQAQQDAQDVSAGDERGGSTATATDSKGDAAEMTSAKPQKSSGADKKQSPAKPSPDVGASEERRLQKLDILREADGGNDAMGDQQEAGAEQGLHLADPKSGLEALGECQDAAGADQKAMGADGQADEESDGEAPAMEEDTPGQDQNKMLPNMRLQETEDAQANEKSGVSKDLLQTEVADEDMQLEGFRGGVNSVQAAPGALASARQATTDDMDVDEEGEGGWRKRSEHEAMQLWGQLERSTTPLSAALCEQLRTILEPTLKGRLQGYFRTGKRISMRRVIPFIASNYRRDKIWLRRTKPSKREYQIVVAIDNSRSMKECGVGPNALQTLCVLCQALAQLEVGEYAVLAFGSATPRVLLPLGSGQSHANSFSWAQAGPLLREFTFEEESVQSHNRSLADLMRLSSELFDERNGPNPARPFSQMSIIISDGRFNKNKVRPWVHAALARQQLPLLIIVDAESETPAANASGSKRSVFDLRAVSYEGGNCQVVPYLSDFPFPYYVVVQDLQTLPAILSDVMKQWFELAASA